MQKCIAILLNLHNLFRRHLGSQLHEMEKLIVRMVEDEFTSFTLSFLHQPINPSNDLILGTLPSAPTPIEDGCLAVDEVICRFSN